MNFTQYSGISFRLYVRYGYHYADFREAHTCTTAFAKRSCNEFYLSPTHGLVTDTRSEADRGGRNITRFLLREEHPKNQSAPQRKLSASV
jgi:hypothetical protein